MRRKAFLFLTLIGLPSIATCTISIKAPTDSRDQATSAKDAGRTVKTAEAAPKPETNIDCQRSSKECSSEGRCISIGDQCVALSNEDCRNSTGCAEAGQCLTRNSKCVAVTDANCSNAKCCQEEGKCYAQDGSCVPLIETICPPAKSPSAFQFTSPKIARCGATNLSWPSRSDWSFLKAPFMCAGGERIYQVVGRVAVTAKTKVIVGATIYAPEETIKWWPPTIYFDENKACQMKHDWCFHTAQPDLFKGAAPGMKAASLMRTDKDYKFGANFCVPDRKPPEVVERVFRFQLRQGDTVLEDCCVHFRSALKK